MNQQLSKNWLIEQLNGLNVHRVSMKKPMMKGKLKKYGIKLQ